MESWQKFKGVVGGGGHFMSIQLNRTDAVTDAAQNHGSALSPGSTFRNDGNVVSRIPKMRGQRDYWFWNRNVQRLLQG